MAAGVKTVRAQGSYIMDKIDLLTGYLIWNPLSELLGKVMGAQAQSQAEKVREWLWKLFLPGKAAE